MVGRAVRVTKMLTSDIALPSSMGQGVPSDAEPINNRPQPTRRQLRAQGPLNLLREQIPQVQDNTAIQVAASFYNFLEKYPM